MDEGDALAAVPNLSAAASRILFSASSGVEGDSSYVNLKPVLWWLRRFAEAGMAPVVGYDASYVGPHAFLLERVC